MVSSHPLAFAPHRAHHGLAVMAAHADEVGATTDDDFAAIG
jgi:hypothetical protein